MKHSLSLVILVNALIFSGCAKRDFTDLPEVKEEIVAQRGDGWEFVEMVGEAHGKPETREIRLSNSTGSLTVWAGNTGIDGNGREQEWRKTFQSDDFAFLEVKRMTGPACGYSLVFRRPHAPK
jgi:hypothetical protein